MSNKWIAIETGEVQVMSAGSGLMHSEMNNLPHEAINLFQIWIIPNQQNVTPRYDQKKFDANERKNKLQLLVSSIDDEVNDVLKIHQDAKISRIDLNQDSDFEYQLKTKNHGVYLMVIEGEVLIENENLKKRDAIGFYNTNSIKLKAIKNSEILFVEVPMNF
jgi:hypothetical protein